VKIVSTILIKLKLFKLKNSIYIKKEKVMLFQKVSYLIVIMGVILVSIAIPTKVYADNPFEHSLIAKFVIPDAESVSCSSSRAKSHCADGTCSTSTGKGTCSGHGGVAGSAPSISQPTLPPPPTNTPQPQPTPTSPPQPTNTPQPQPTPTSPPQPTNTPAINISNNQPATTQNQPVAVVAPEPVVVPTSGGVLSMDNGIFTVIISVGLLIMLIGGGIYSARR
jgi:hypothetical protein